MVSLRVSFFGYLPIYRRFRVGIIRDDSHPKVLNAQALGAALKFERLCTFVGVQDLTASQGQVWNSVAEEQEKLSKAVDSSVTSPESHSSYQLTLEHKKVQERIRSCVETLHKEASSQMDTIGFVFAIGDDLNNADVYANHDLFVQLWDKLLKAAATEAVAESKRKKDVSKKKPTTEDVEHFLEKKDLTTGEPRLVTPRVQLRQYGNEKKFRFETEDLEQQAACVHTNVISH